MHESIHEFIQKGIHHGAEVRGGSGVIVTPVEDQYNTYVVSEPQNGSDSFIILDFGKSGAKVETGDYNYLDRMNFPGETVMATLNGRQIPVEVNDKLGVSVI